MHRLLALAGTRVHEAGHSSSHPTSPLTTLVSLLWQLTEAPSKPAEGLFLKKEISKLFPETFHEDLKELLVGFLAKSTPKWRQEILNPASGSSSVLKESGKKGGGASGAPKWRPFDEQGGGSGARGDVIARDAR